MSRTAGDGDDGEAILAEDGGEVDDFVGFAGEGDAEDGVGGAEAAEVAVRGFGGVDGVRGNAERGEGGGDLGADEARFAEPGDQDGAVGPGALDDEVDRPVEVLAERGKKAADGVGLGAEDALDELAFAGPIHGGEVGRGGRGRAAIGHA